MRWRRYNRRHLYTKHAAADYDSIIIIVADNTDALILRMAVQARIDSGLCVNCDTRVRTRILDVKKMCAGVGQGACAALLGMHAFTGCGIVSAF